MFGNRQPVSRPAATGDDGRFMPETTDFASGRWRLSANRDNDYMIDRAAQKTVNYTGIGNIHLQDQAITESMGPIYLRQHEHLGTSDSMIIRTRRRLIKAAKAHRDEGVIPAVVDHPELYRVRSGGVVIPRNADWLQATADLRRVDREIEEALALRGLREERTQEPAPAEVVPGCLCSKGSSSLRARRRGEVGSG